MNISNTFRSFIQLCRAYSNCEISMQRVSSINENELVEKINETGNEINRALADDFTTSVAVESLADLVSYINRLFQASFTSVSSDRSSSLNCHYGPIMAACNYVQNTLEMFGLDYNETVSSSSQVPGDDLNIKEIVEAALRFRKNIRTIALEKTASSGDETTKKKLFGVCDQFRDDLRRANIEFKVINYLLLGGGIHFEEVFGRKLFCLLDKILNYLVSSRLNSPYQSKASLNFTQSRTNPPKSVQTSSKVTQSHPYSPKPHPSSPKVTISTQMGLKRGLRSRWTHHYYLRTVNKGEHYKFRGR